MSRHWIVAAVLTALAACESPEAARGRGGGPGADIGNRGDAIRMHEGSRPYAGTPHISGAAIGPRDSAEQARELSRQ